MKAIFSICIAIVLSGSVYAQDTLRKLGEYDIRIDAVSKIEHPWLQKVFEVSGDRSWLEVLLENVASGKLKVYDSYTFSFYRNMLSPEYIKNSMDGTLVDTIVVVDPVTLEEAIATAPVEPWSAQSIIAWRIAELSAWDEATQKMKTNILGFAPIMEQYDESWSKGPMPIFWIIPNAAER